MYRLLIVDDEAFIVNGLVEMVEEADDLDVEVYKAYSALEAMAWLKRTRIDIVLSDISMPAMDGLELQRMIVRQWPQCRVIFLTGFDDFSYVKEALRHEAVDYILKMEGDDAIRSAIRKAIRQLDREVEAGDLVMKARAQMQAALPALQRDCLLQVLTEEGMAAGALSHRFEAYQIPLDVHAPVLLVLGAVDEWPHNAAGPDRSLLLYAIQNISQELLAYPPLRLVTFAYESKYTAMLVQARERESMVMRYLQAALERIQSACRQWLRIKISLAHASQFVEWPLLGRKYEMLKWMLGRSPAMGRELLLSDRSIPLLAPAPYRESDVNRLLHQLDRLESELDGGTRESFRQAYDHIVSACLPLAEIPNLRATIAVRLAAIFMTYLTKEGLWATAAEVAPIQDLAARGSPVAWDRMADIHRRLGDWIFDRKEDDARQHSRNVIHLLHAYIENHLSDDLSLTRLGEVAALNPVYLSRLYKRTTGENLSDYVLRVRIDRAKELLKRTNGKMQDIAAQVGFDSASYFSKCFKKLTSVTPQEYRES